jgi:hypothetical protein
MRQACCSPARGVPPPVMLCRGFRTAKIFSQRGKAERSRGAQYPGERPAPPRKLEARQAGMQVRTPAREPGLWVGLDDVPYRDKTQQAGLDRTLLAAYTGTHYGRTRGVPPGSRGHLPNKLTVSGLPRHPAGSAPGSPVHPARRRRQKGRPYHLTPLILPSLPSLAGLLGRRRL